MNELETAKATLLSGGIIIFPTDTVYGIGCLINFPKSIEKLYSIKKRDSAKPTLVLGKNLEQLEKLVTFNSQALVLANKFWPGPLTIALPAKKLVPKSILGRGKTLAVRIPTHPWINSLLDQINKPLLAPSANFQNRLPARNFSQIDKELVKLVDYVVDIEPGGLEPSTIVTFAKDNKYTIVRPGPISKESLDQALSDI